MQKITKTYYGEAERLKTQILQAAGETANLVDGSETVRGDTMIGLYIYEKFFMRNNSVASLSLQLIQEQESVELTAVSSGSGYGYFKLDWGAADKLIEVLEENLCRIIKKN